MMVKAMISRRPWMKAEEDEDEFVVLVLIQKE